MKVTLALALSIWIGALFFATVLGQQRCIELQGSNVEPASTCSNFTVTCNDLHNVYVEWTPLGRFLDGSCTEVKWGYDCFDINQTLLVEQSIFFEGYGVEGDKNVMGLESASTCVFYACGVIDGDKPHPLPASTGTVTCTAPVSSSALETAVMHSSSIIVPSSEKSQTRFTSMETTMKQLHTGTVTQLTVENTVQATPSTNGSNNNTVTSVVIISILVFAITFLFGLSALVILCFAWKFKTNRQKLEMIDFFIEQDDNLLQVKNLGLLSESKFSLSRSLVTITSPVEFPNINKSDNLLGIVYPDHALDCLSLEQGMTSLSIHCNDADSDCQSTESEITTHLSPFTESKYDTFEIPINEINVQVQSDPPTHRTAPQQSKSIHTDVAQYNTQNSDGYLYEIGDKTQSIQPINAINSSTLISTDGYLHEPRQFNYTEDGDVSVTLKSAEDDYLYEDDHRNQQATSVDCEQISTDGYLHEPRQSNCTEHVYDDPLQNAGEEYFDEVGLHLEQTLHDCEFTSSNGYLHESRQLDCTVERGVSSQCVDDGYLHDSSQANFTIASADTANNHHLFEELSWDSSNNISLIDDDQDLANDNLQSNFSLTANNSTTFGVATTVTETSISESDTAHSQSKMDGYLYDYSHKHHCSSSDSSNACCACNDGSYQTTNEKNLSEKSNVLVFMRKDGFEDSRSVSNLEEDAKYLQDNNREYSCNCTDTNGYSNGPAYQLDNFSKAVHIGASLQSFDDYLLDLQPELNPKNTTTNSGYFSMN